MTSSGTLKIAEGLNIFPNYCLCHSIKNNHEQGPYGTYGIMANDVGGNLLCRIEDVSTDSVTVKILVEQLNTFEVSELHFMDIVEDYLAVL